MEKLTQTKEDPKKVAPKKDAPKKDTSKKEAAPKKDVTPKPETEKLINKMKSGGVTTTDAVKILVPDLDWEDKEAVKAAGRNARRVLRNLVEKHKGTKENPEGSKTKVYKISA